jgi:hypothetical protein
VDDPVGETTERCNLAICNGKSGKGQDAGIFDELFRLLKKDLSLLCLVDEVGFAETLLCRVLVS